MRQIINKRYSIYAQLFGLLVVSALAAGILFLILNHCGEILINHCLYDTNYVENQNQKYVGEMQDYITKKELSSTDTEKLKEWVEKQNILIIQIYKDNIQIFDSTYPDQDILEEEIEAANYEWISYHPIEFSDGSAEIVISGLYGYRLNNLALIIEISVAFSLFLLFVLLGIRKKMNYIKKLSCEIGILEGGRLDYAVTIQGADELALLAEGIDDMRVSFQKLIQNEMEMVSENRRIVTEMSHDIRTPITSIMLYTEILKKGQYKDDVQLKNYIEKIEHKAQRLKQLTDHLFEYSLTSNEEAIELEEPENVEIIFFDLFSETCGCLNQQGFKVDFRVEFPDKKIRISSDYLMRIMDNITSNIIKYADMSSPVQIISINDEQTKNSLFEEHSAENMFCILFENKISICNDNVESTGIGLQNIKNIMWKMNGKCKTETKGNVFRLYLFFPFC